jgi:hypothetical protein
MTSKVAKPQADKNPPAPRNQADVSHPGMMGDGTQEQNLGERGKPGARIDEREVKAAFGKNDGKKPSA